MSGSNRRHAGVVGAGVAAGVAVAALAVLSTGDRGVGNLGEVAAFTAALAGAWVFPLFVSRGEETEALHVHEAFFVLLALLLPPLAAVVAFAVAPAAHLLRRRPLSRVVFNSGQLAAAAGAGSLTVHALAPGLPGTVTPRAMAAAMAGLAVFFLLNSGAVAAAIAFTERRSLVGVWTDALGLKLVVFAGSSALGLMGALAGSAYRWAILLALAPLTVLHVVLHGYGRARRDRARMDGLLGTAVDAHSSISVGDVAVSVIESARILLRCREARLDLHPPQEGELGVRVTHAERPDQWLVVRGRVDVEPFDDADRKLLEAIGAIGSVAIDNAVLYEEAREERRKLANVVQSSSDGIFSVGPDRRIQSWNPAMERITGSPAEQAVGARCFAAFRGRSEDGVELCMGTCPGLCGPHDQPVPVQLATAAGEPRWLNCTYSPMPGGGYVVVARDVTAQKEVDDLKADFLATVSHELRTPLTPIQGFLRTLLRADARFDPDEQRRFFELMLHQSERLERLVNDLLDATSLQDRDHLFFPTAVDWAASVSDTVELFRGQDPGREFVLELQDHLPRVLADEQRAEQILANLVGNAVKYSGTGDPVRITVETCGDEVRTTVADRGPGIPARDRDRIFERFTRLGDPLTRRVGGAGLGLFIARRLIDAMGGTLTVDTAPEGGAAFTFSLPVALEPAPSSN